jgi:SPP1 family predicted phage head-tail adaptor
MKPIAYKLRHRVDIQEFAAVQDSETGATTEEFVSILSSDDPLIPAEIVPLSGREFVAAQAVQAGVTTRITIRWQDGIAPSMRVVHDGMTYNIKAVLPDPTLRRHITLMCEQGVSNG